ncbi:TIGR03619 family F420-dependent LLM class oxidoreductase [Nocardia sp. XZ_19_385]|uniref:TIGR03619 family F420-dependent LLM class oxidoreductase n=1 Tax=Nocardia sp. XZ_19_385 TaxID=2769488 RepID=UPI001890008B|nr:TIGR03619 family F420-dependent LLM class oxidoreductase [Nocardia sp. XZ_19_385]
MKIGFSLPQLGAHAREAARIPEFAAAMEKAGADSLWVGDRLMAATDPKVGYAGSATIPPEFNQVLDPFLTLALAASATERVRLGANVLIAPLYPPAILARALTTLDVASGGRLIPGFGIGWSPEEYEAAGVPFTKRGARLEQTLDALEAIWTTDPAEYSGSLVSVPRHRTELKPVQKPRPPIHLAAFTPAAMERVGRRGDGWLPVVPVPGPPEWGVQLRKLRGVVDHAAEQAGRDPGAIETIVRVNVKSGTPLEHVADAVRRTAGQSGFDDFFIDLTYVSASVDNLLDDAHHLLALLD